MVLILNANVANFSELLICLPQIELQNLFGGGAISDLISGVATDVLPAMVQELQPQIVDSVMNYINTLIRNIISPWGKTATPSSVRSKEN